MAEKHPAFPPPMINKSVSMTSVGTSLISVTILRLMIRHLSFSFINFLSTVWALVGPRCAWIPNWNSPKRVPGSHHQQAKGNGHQDANPTGLGVVCRAEGFSPVRDHRSRNLG